MGSFFIRFKLNSRSLCARSVGSSAAPEKMEGGNRATVAKKNALCHLPRRGDVFRAAPLLTERLEKAKGKQTLRDKLRGSQAGTYGYTLQGQ